MMIFVAGKMGRARMREKEKERERERGDKPRGGKGAGEGSRLAAPVRSVRRNYQKL